MKLRDDRRDAINSFLESVQKVEELVEQRMRGHLVELEVLRSAVHTVWYRQKCVEVVGTPELQDAAFKFALRIQETFETDSGGSYNDFLNDARFAFIEAARNTLSATDEAESNSAA